MIALTNLSTMEIGICIYIMTKIKYFNKINLLVFYTRYILLLIYYIKTWMDGNNEEICYSIR